MRKINLDNIQEFTRFKNPVGGFICQIMAVEDVPDKEYLKVFYDIAEALSPEQEEFVGMYTKRKQERQFEYPSTVVSYKENSLPFFKGFVTALEASNKGYQFDSDETKMVGKKIGFVIAEEEYEGRDKNGAPKVKVRTYVAERHSVQAIKDGEFKVPEFKKLAQSTTAKPANPFATNGSAPTATTTAPPPVPDEVFAATDEDDDDIPF
jgi:hypothetical protein